MEIKGTQYFEDLRVVQNRLLGEKMSDLAISIVPLLKELMAGLFGVLETEDPEKLEYFLTVHNYLTLSEPDDEYFNQDYLNELGKTPTEISERLEPELRIFNPPIMQFMRYYVEITAGRDYILKPTRFTNKDDIFEVLILAFQTLYKQEIDEGTSWINRFIFNASRFVYETFIEPHFLEEYKNKIGGFHRRTKYIIEDLDHLGEYATLVAAQIAVDQHRS